MTEAEKGFEELISRLEEIVRILENGTATLDESLKLYEEGISLVQVCNEQLDCAEKKIRILTRTPDTSIQKRNAEDENA